MAGPRYCSYEVQNSEGSVQGSEHMGQYEAAATLTEFELKKILIDKMDKSESYLAAPKHRECYEGLIKSYDLDKNLFSTYDKKRKTSKDAEPTKGPKAKESQSSSSKGTKSQPKYSGKFCSSEEPEFEALSEKLDWENPEGSDYPFDLTNPLPLVMSGNCQKVPVDYFFNNDLKHLKDLVPFIMGSVKVCFDKNAFWGISNWREQVEVMRKHGYGYLKEIIVRKADNDLYRFKEGDFLRLRNNDIEDMLLLLERERHRLTNLLGNDVFGTYANSIMYVHNQAFGYQKRVKDLHLGVKSYQKKINVTKPETTKLGIRKRDPYTPYQDPQGFIYVDNNGRNRLMRSDELYKFSDRTLTGLQTSLDDITKNIQRKSTCQRGEMEYIVHHKEKS
ncbi:hypothetical protein Tco_0392937 [Tanacetum coccineum]